MISVIIPMYNAEKSNVQALDSIRNQTYDGKFEIIVINDGSTDSSQSLIEEYQQKHPEIDLIIINQKIKVFQLREIKD